MSVDVYVGQRVRMRRIQLGMSQEKLAKGVGLTFQQVQKYEKGANRMGSSRLVQFANLLDVPVGWLFEGAPGTGKDNVEGGVIRAYTKFVAEQMGGRAMLSWALMTSPEQRAAIDLFEAMTVGRGKR